MSKYKVLATPRSFGTADRKAEELLEANGCEVEKITPDQLTAKLPEADAVIAGLEEYDRELISSAGRLRVISRYGVGYDKVDLQAAADCGVTVTITPGANGDSVADLAMALMLDCARNVTIMDSGIKSGNQIRPSGLEMWEKTVGIVGAGRIGKGVARRCSGFHMRLLCFDAYQDPAFAEQYGAKYVDFETLLEEADFITIHSPLTPETENMFGTEQFRKMKKDAILVNTARGGIVDEEALYDALQSGEIRAAGLDALAVENACGSRLATLQNCILTPHAGAATREASSRTGLMAAQNVLDILQRGECRNTVG